MMKKKTSAKIRQALSKIGLRKKLEIKEMIKETSRKIHSKHAALKSQLQNIIRHTASNRGK